ncbi:MAG: tRNA uracil 4-sulfurtransferase ThiI [Gammaproteobacteria bacterium]|nr:tRNA uracil 4-sulfurtransferase ThiI [Gammaproteobacteria bacterium]
MLFVVRFFPEITIKTRQVRRRMIRVLRRSLRTQLTAIDEGISVLGEWDNLEIRTDLSDPVLLERIMTLLAHTPGIAAVMQVRKCPLPDMEGILALARTCYGPLLQGKTFAVRCKRQGVHPYNSMDVERFVGAGLMNGCGARGVNLNNPEVEVKIEIHHDEMFVVERTVKGLGGYPLGTQDGVLSLISGGFDSAVSSYLCIRRGLITHYCFFNLGGREHELAVKEVALYLWLKYSASHRVKFVTVPFEGVVEEIVTKIGKTQMGVVLKRMMLRAADRVAGFLKLEALVTGECVAQVASQTIANLAIIDRVTDKLVLRPLITSDKQEIIDLARRIGTEEFSKHVPEYCGVISVRPTTRARLPRIEAEEARFNFDVLETAIQNIEIQMIDRVIEGVGNKAIKVEEVAAPESGVVIIDIRHPEEEEARPLVLPAELRAVVEKIPFYELRTRFSALPRGPQYLLYCDRGIMSRLHASHLRDAGHEQVAVYRPPQSVI